MTQDTGLEAQVQQRIREDPVWFATEVLGVRPWSVPEGHDGQSQEDALRALTHGYRTSCRSGNGSGKSWIAGIAAIWFALGFGPACTVVIMSAGMRGVEHTLWPVIRRLYRNARIDLGGTVMHTQWRLGEQWEVIGVAADDPEAIGGLRADNGVLVIVDEASALSQDMFEAIEGITSSHNGRIFLIGNPLRTGGPFYESFRTPGWENVHISSLNTPNVIAGENVVPGLATREWVELQRVTRGENSPFFVSRVLGEFPDMGDNQLVPMAWVDALRRRERPCERVGRLRVGVDVARFGGDRSVAVLRDDGAILDKEVWSGKSTMETAGRIIRLMKRWSVPPEQVAVDDNGLGGGVVDRLREQGYSVCAVNNGAKASDSGHFSNVRAETYWALREAINPEGDAPLAIAATGNRDFEGMMAELLQPSYSLDSKGRIKIESKDAIKARLGCSPDEADALALTFAQTQPFDLFVPGYARADRVLAPVAARPIQEDDGWR